MAWATPVIHATGDVVTASDWNIDSNDLTFLYGDSGWTNVSTFTNGWGATAAAPAFMLMGRVVYLRGALSAGTANTAAFTLPAGYRPGISGPFVGTGSSNNFADISVNSTGTVVPVVSQQTWLHGISFPAL